MPMLKRTYSTQPYCLYHTGLGAPERDCRANEKDDLSSKIGAISL